MVFVELCHLLRLFKRNFGQATSCCFRVIFSDHVPRKSAISSDGIQIHKKVKGMKFPSYLSLDPWMGMSR